MNVFSAQSNPLQPSTTTSLTPKPLIEKLLTSKEKNHCTNTNSSNKINSSIPFSSGAIKEAQNSKVARKLLNDSNVNNNNNNNNNSNNNPTTNKNVSKLNSQIKISSFLTKPSNASFKKPTTSSKLDEIFGQMSAMKTSNVIITKSS